MKVDLTSLSPPASLADIRRATVDLLPIFADGNQNAPGWTISFTVKPLLVATPPVAEYTDPLVHGGPFPVRRLTIEAAIPLSDLVLTFDPQLVTAATVSTSPDRQRFEIDVAPAPGLEPRALSAPLRLQPKPRDGDERLPAATLAVRALVVDGIHLVPASIDFGALRVGEAAVEAVVVASRTGKAFTLAGIHSPNGELAAAPFLGADAAQPAIEMKQTATAAGRQSATVSVTVDAEGLGRRRLELPVHYYGIVDFATDNNPAPPGSRIGT